MSYNGYNYTQYFNSGSQNTDRQGSHPSQSQNSMNLNHSIPSYRQQQTDTRGYNASQPRQWNDQPNSSVQPSSNQWYNSGNVTSGGEYQGSTTTTSAYGPQSQYIGAAGRSGGSHLDTSALGSLAYASGLESSGVDGPLQTNGRTYSDYNATSRRVQTPPARLVSPMHGSTTTALANSNNHVRSGSTGSTQSQFVPSYRHAQQHLPTGHGHAQVVNTDHNPYRPGVGVSSLDPGAKSRQGSSTSTYSNAGANSSGYKGHKSELPTQQARSLVPERRTSSPRHSQQVHSSAPLENHRWQTSSGNVLEMSNAQANNVQHSHHSPEISARSVRSAASTHPQLDLAHARLEATSNAVPQHVSQTNGSGQSWSDARRPSGWERSNLQEALGQTERVRQHQLSQVQELHDPKLHPHQRLIHHSLQDVSMPAPSTAPSAAPITVDPSRVFNPYHQEYQRQKALTDAEGARKDNRSSLSLHDSTPVQSQASTRADPQIRSSISNVVVRTATPTSGSPDIRGGNVANPSETAAKGANSGLESSEKQQMEAEMKLMLEKMRDYKAKDPSLFLHIWDQVKKCEPGLADVVHFKGTRQTTLKTPTLPQAGAVGQESSQIPAQPPFATDGSVAVAPTDKSQLPSPSPTILQLPVAWEQPVDSSPDLGKFPAMRRRRGAGRRSRLPRPSQTGPPEQSEKSVSSNPSPQAVAYGPQSHVHNDAPSHGVQPHIQLGQQNELPTLSNTTLHPSKFPEATRDDKQTYRALPDMRPPIPDRVSSKEASFDTAPTAVARPSDVPKQSFEGSLQEQRDSAAGIPTDHSSHNTRIGIVWPDSKKTALATAAERALTSTATNAGKQISIGVIRTLLDSNPSYIELCESFEKLGFVFDRGHFARMLLAAVPDINSSTSTPSTMNATSNHPIELNRASQDLSRAAISASESSVNRAIPLSTTADTAGSAARLTPELTAIPGLSAMSPNVDVGQPRRSKTRAQPITGPLDLTKRSRGRPRKDGSPAQARHGGRIRQPRGNHVNSIFQNNAPSAAVQTASRSLPIDPVLLAADRENTQRLGSHIDLNMHDHTQSVSRSSNDHQQVSGSRDTLHNVPLQDLNGPSTTQSVVNGSANAEGINRNAGPDIPDTAGQKAPKQISRDNLKWDRSKKWTESLLQDLSRQEKPHNTEVTQVPPPSIANAKRDNASNLNANPPTQPHSRSHNSQNHSALEHISKREMARKRDFNDIVDLNQHVSGEEDNLDQPLHKRPKGVALAPPNSAPESLLYTPPWVVQPAPVVSSDPSAGVDTPVTGGSMDISKFNLPTSGPLSQKTALYMNVVNPLNKRRALRRSEYNAKTIARDVLIAAGRHPDMRALNAHLDSLRRNFYAVEFGSDLATFNWDLVDPKPAGDHGAGIDGSIHDADDEDDGVAVFEQQTSFAIAQPPHRRAVLSGADSGVEVLGSPMALDNPIQKLGKDTTIKRRGPQHHSYSGHSVRPAGYGHGGHATETPGMSGVATPAEQSSAQLTDAGRGSSLGVRVEVTAPSVNSNANVPDNTQSPLVAGTSEKKPRGRPPKNGQSSSSTPSRSAQTSRAGSSRDDTDDDKEKKRRGRPPGSKNRTPQSSASHADGRLSFPTRPKSSANTTPARSALRNASTPLGDQPFAVIVDPTSRTTHFRRSESQRKRKSELRDPSRRTRGRPSAASKAEPTYKVYACRWKDCQAELHNLETLRKHVRKVHRTKAAFGGIPCLWAGCGKVSFVQDRKTGRHNRVHQCLDFGTEDLWDQHMDKKHLEPFAWDLGDGPSAGPSDGPDTDLSDYLSDRKGRRITPQATSSGPQDALILPAKKQPLRAYNKTHGNKTELEKAQAIFKALEHRKQIVGPGIERGGCTLVIPARRAALRDSEFAVQVLDEDDESS